MEFELTDYNDVKEIWLDIKGYEGQYQISNFGNVKSLSRKIWNGKVYASYPEIILKTFPYENKYLNVKLYKNSKLKTYMVHRMVAEYFIPNILDKREVNHKDGNKHNNHISNLEWVSHKENAIHAFENGLTNTKHMDKEIIQLKDGVVINTFKSISEGERQTNIKVCNISSCCHGRQKTAGGYEWRFANV